MPYITSSNFYTWTVVEEVVEPKAAPIQLAMPINTITEEHMAAVEAMIPMVNEMTSDARIFIDRSVMDKCVACYDTADYGELQRFGVNEYPLCGDHARHGMIESHTLSIVDCRYCNKVIANRNDGECMDFMEAWEYEFCSKKCFEAYVTDRSPANHYKQIGIKIEPINLAKEAAEMYLLSAASQDDSFISSILRSKVASLAPSFARYMFLASFGEARHLKSSVNYSNTDCHYPMLQPYVNEILKVNTSNGRENFNREDSWLIAQEFANRPDYIMYAAAVKYLYQFNWCGGYGGYAWENIMMVLLMYETGKLNPMEFVDSAFSLTHNGCLFFDKAWNINGLDRILTAAFHDDYKVLKYFAGDEINRVVHRKLFSGRILTN